MGRREDSMKKFTIMNSITIRRISKKDSEYTFRKIIECDNLNDLKIQVIYIDSKGTVIAKFIDENNNIYSYIAPFKIGDILYVKEMFFKKEIVNDSGKIVNQDGNIVYFSDVTINKCKNDDFDYYNINWNRAINMKKEDSKLSLKITNISIERAKDIELEGMKDEGCLPEFINEGIEEKLRRNYWKPFFNKKFKNYSSKYKYSKNPFMWKVSFTIV